MYLSLLLVSLLAGCAAQPEYPPLTEEVASLYDPALKPFYHGVASGDPTQDAVIIWTRITPATQLPAVEVTWELSTDETFATVLQQGTLSTGPERDYTVKVDVQGLQAGTQYYYRFKGLEGLSPKGATKTAPAQAEQLNFAVVSCSNYENGYFNAYGAIADDAEIDAVIHLGDYIYEYESGRYGDTSIGRLNLPDKELIALSDYRTRYSQYHLDPDLRDAHGRHAFINIWDDHEIANDAYKTGAQNHQDEEGDYEVRKSDAVQAYYEWIPIREGAQHYRAFSYGQLAELIMLDERLEGRSRQADSLADPSLQDAERVMLGKTQFDWLADRLLNSDATWKVIGNQVIFSYLNWGFEPNFTINLDSWDGYPVEQKALASIVDSIDNVIFITGDTHTSWAFEVTADPFGSYDSASGTGAIAVEFGTTSISSGNSNERYPDEEVIAHEVKISSAAINPHVRYVNMRDHGYLLLHLDQTAAQASWYYVPTLYERTRNTTIGKELMVRAGETRLRAPE